MKYSFSFGKIFHDKCIWNKFFNVFCILYLKIKKNPKSAWSVPLTSDPNIPCCCFFFSYSWGGPGVRYRGYTLRLAQRQSMSVWRRILVCGFKPGVFTRQQISGFVRYMYVDEKWVVIVCVQKLCVCGSKNVYLTGGSPTFSALTSYSPISFSHWILYQNRCWLLNSINNLTKKILKTQTELSMINDLAELWFDSGSSAASIRFCGIRKHRTPQT